MARKSALTVMWIFLPLLLVSCGEKEAANKSPYAFEGPISREVLDNYLDRAVTMSEFLTVDPFTNDGKYPCKERDVEFIRNTGAKFIGRAIYRWGGEEVLAKPAFWNGARSLIEQIHAFDPEVILQGAAFEAVYRNGIRQVPIPAWTFEALGHPVEERRFDYNAMLDPNGKYVDWWGKDASVPDITQVETQLWFMYLIGSFVNVGIEAIHLGQIYLIGMNDPEYRVWQSFLRKVRAYATKNARRGWILFDAHVHGGAIVDGVSLLDFNSFPLRIKEVADQPMKGMLEAGYLDSQYGKSLGCVTPSGWKCDRLPYLVEFDNFGYRQDPPPGAAVTSDHYTWGWDEISWFYKQDKEYKVEFLNYAYDWLKANDPVGHLEMPGARVISLGAESPVFIGRAIAPSPECPHGMDIEEVIKEIWNR